MLQSELDVNQRELKTTLWRPERLTQNTVNVASFRESSSLALDHFGDGMSGDTVSHDAVYEFKMTPMLSRE